MPELFCEVLLSSQKYKCLKLVVITDKHTFHMLDNLDASFLSYDHFHHRSFLFVIQLKQNIILLDYKKFNGDHNLCSLKVVQQVGNYP